MLEPRIIHIYDSRFHDFTFSHEQNSKNVETVGHLISMNGYLKLMKSSKLRTVIQNQVTFIQNNMIKWLFETV